MLLADLQRRLEWIIHSRTNDSSNGASAVPSRCPIWTDSKGVLAPWLRVRHTKPAPNWKLASITFSVGHTVEFEIELEYERIARGMVI